MHVFLVGSQCRDGECAGNVSMIEEVLPNEVRHTLHDTVLTFFLLYFDRARTSH